MSGVAAEADWTRAPGLFDGAAGVRLTPERCHVEYWLRNVAQGTLRDLRWGHTRGARVPDLMLEPGPLRSAVIDEFAFRAVSEELATRTLSLLVLHAPTIPTLEFYATQLVDEARHAAIFRRHLVELGIPEGEVRSVIDAAVGERRDTVLRPLEEFGLAACRRGEDFIAGVVLLTVLVEGVLAPAAELSEHKWKVFDPPAAEVCRGANIDELRHLNVGSEIVRRHLLLHPGERDRLRELVDRGLELWRSIPVDQLIVDRELQFQQGIERHGALLGGLELVEGCLLRESTVEQRLLIARDVSERLQQSRLAYMGLA